MKKIIYFILIFLLFSGTAFAADEKDDISLVDQTNTIYQASVMNVQNLIDSKDSLQDFVTTRAISGIDTTEKPSGQDYRTCPFCWIFAAVFASFLFQFGKELKKRKSIPKNWFEKPVYVALYIYLAHAVIHVFIASSIFLYYYWMILFDELVIAFFCYYNFIIIKKKLVRRMTKKTA